MEANFFRFLAGELSTALTGQRIEKVHSPADGVLILTLYGQGRKSNLTFRPAKQAGLLFVSDQRPQNPAAAPARVMWLRKRLTGRRLLEARADWPALRLAFALSPRDVPAAGQWLVLDLRADLTLDEDFPLPPEPAWPDLPRLLDDAEVWRAFAQATPPLRKHLAALAQADPGRAERLLARLREGRPEGFFLSPHEGAAPPLAWPPLAWPPLALPTLAWPKLVASPKDVLSGNAPPSEAPGQTSPAAAQRYDSALAAARAYGERALFAHLGRLDAREGLDQAAATKKRLARQLDLIAKDEARHRALAGLALPAEALQIALSGMHATPRAESITLEHPEHGPQNVPLDPRLSPAENMARLFRLAAKGRRGLEHCERRRAQLLAGAGPEMLPAREAKADNTPAQTKPAPAAPFVLPKRYQGLAVSMFRTSDGFMALRGKSSQANHDMLSKAASPHDYWLHVAGGPSAHVILRRDYPDQSVPEQSLMEAATLCALKSYRKDDAKAEVLLARVKDVRKVKGAAIGSVAVDEVERTLLVALDPELEQRLAAAPPRPIKK